MEKLILYVRKSTDTEDKQVLSIEAQLNELRKFARDNHLVVIDEMIEKRTAKMPGRPVFNSLLTRIKNGEASGILAWHPDRLARNSVDGGEIVYLVDTGVISRLVFPTFWFEPTPQGKFMLNMAFGQSKYYVDSLSENTKRGLREKVRRGEFPGPAPIGYLNDYRTKTIIPDPELSSVIRQIYEAYASGHYTHREISSLLKEKGITTRTGKPYSYNRTISLLTNPFYYGLFRYGGEIYEGSHKPIIEKSLFDKVQRVLIERGHQYNRKEIKHDLCGLFHCSCGMMITAENKIKVQKNGNRHNYIYYRCSRKSKTIKCKERPIREELLDARLSDFLLEFSPPKAMINFLSDKLEQEATEELASSQVGRSKIEQKLRNIEAKQKILFDSYLEQDIDRETFIEKKSELLNEKKTLSELLKGSNTNQNSWVEPMRNWLNSLGSIYKIAKSDNLVAKKSLALELFGLNLFLTDQHPTLKANRSDGRAGENGLATPAPQAHFRLYSELRSVIKNRSAGEKIEDYSALVPETGLEPARQLAYAPKAYVYTNFTTRAYMYYNTKKPETKISGFDFCEKLNLYFTLIECKGRHAGC